MTDHQRADTLTTGQVVMVLGLFHQRRCRIYLDRPPAETIAGHVMLCGYGGGKFRTRIVPADQMVELTR